MQPFVLFVISVHEMLLIKNILIAAYIRARVSSRGSGANKLKAHLNQRINCLLEKGMFEIVARRVPFTYTMIWISAFVECITEYLTAKANTTTYKNS